jgi:pimeloyl-ACP methyl ester carboxylesterase
MATARVHGIELYYEVIGHGYPLTMIMGLGCSARMWRWMVPFFAHL